ALTRSGFIFEYDREGTLLFVFAGSAEGMSRPGLFKNASAIARRSNDELLVLDQANNTIHVLVPTHFGDVVHEALGLYNQGKYIESQALWEEVMRYNALFDLAHEGVGLSYFMQGDYDAAMEKFTISESKTEYSNAFWEVRNIFLLSHAGMIMILGLSCVAVFFLAKGIDRRTAFLKPLESRLATVSQRPVVREIANFFYFIKNPADACYEVKVRNAIRIRTALLYIVLLVMIYTVHLLYTGMLFTDRVLERTVYVEELMKVFIPFVSFVLGNYLVSSLMDGEGTLKAVLINTLGALIPVVVILPVMTLLSNVLTYNEAFLYQLLFVAMVTWTSVLVFFSIKETHHYTVRETIYNLLLTALMMVIMILASIMVVLMIRQVIDFIGDIIKEVAIRG
ncbi:MAG: tetratricopeptide repeat protein, partial [Acholeplasmataceae bacterium]